MIRKYTKQDWNKIKILCKDEKYLDDYAVFFKDSHYIVFLFFEQSKLLGTIVVSRSLDNLNVDYLYVSPICRGKGIGTKLTSYIEKYAQKKKYAGVRIDTSITNKKAIRFYKKLGYKNVGRVKNYYMAFGQQYFLWKKI